MSNFIIRIIGTFFYVGYLPFIPGTFGSLAGLLLFLSCKDNTSAYISLTCAVVLLGFLVAGAAERLIQQKDARCIVIDEVAGMLISLFLIPYDIRLLILAFLIFRILDSFKPYPAGGLQHLKGSLGIMSDDIVAGLYTNLILQVALRLTSFSAS